jgi:hypothetical protein
MKETSKFIPLAEVRDVERCDAPDLTMIDRLIISNTD